MFKIQTQAKTRSQSLGLGLDFLTTRDRQKDQDRLLKLGLETLLRLKFREMESRYILVLGPREKYFAFS